MFPQPSLRFVAALAFFSLPALPSRAQDAGALVDKLIQKGILTDQEGEEVRADMTRDFARTDAGKIALNPSLTELKLYGDTRLRYQYDTRDAQVEPGPGNSTGTQTSRWRFRLRLNADFRLAENFFGGVELQSGIVSDSGNQTYENGFRDYDIFISRAYIGWEPAPWLTIVGGKMPPYMYHTDMFWDTDINPNGAFESIAFHKMRFGGMESGAGYSQDGKSVASTSVRTEPNWELTLNAAQFIFDDNAESALDNDANTDPWMLYTQLVAACKFGNGTKITIAPGYFTYINGALTALENGNKFEDNAFVSGASRNLNLLLLPGDVSFKLGDLKTKIFWDFSYNLDGQKRTEDIYRLFKTVDGKVRSQHSAEDDIAFLAGIRFGENKKKGDWSFQLDYRQLGIAGVDPNLTDSDWGAAELNLRGVRVLAAYNLADFVVVQAWYSNAWNLRQDLTGGEATEFNKIAEFNEVQTFILDLSMKF